MALLPQIYTRSRTKTHYTTYRVGDLIARVTTAIGIKPCGGCKGRQQQLNKWWFDLTDKLSEAMK